MEMEKVKKELMHMFHAWRILLGSLVKWILLSIVIGGVIGVIASAFANLITWATDFRMGHMWMVYLLPFAGLMIVFLYHVTGQEKNAGTDMVLMVVRSDQNTMPGRVAPLILIATALTHLFGGSAGREGAALQFGASLGNWLGRKIHLNESDKRIMTLAGMSAAFAALFGTPMAAALFPMEVISVGIMYYATLVPCVFSAFIGERISIFMGVRTLTAPYPVEEVPNFYGIAWGKAILLAICFAFAGALFCVMLHIFEKQLKKWFQNPYLRVFVGGVTVVLLWKITGTDTYLGLGGGTIAQSFAESQKLWVFLLKMLFTCITLCAGFKGGEIVPSLFIGATFGSALAPIFGLPVDICAACGMVGVFCAVTNSPISSLLIAFELFGFAGMPYFCTVIAVSYLLSGYQSLYKAQKIVYSKTENKYIDRNTTS